MRPKALGNSLSLSAFILLLTLSGCHAMGVFWLNQSVKGELTDSLRTNHLVLRFRPSGNAAKNSGPIGVLVERELARICAALEVENDQTYTLFLFENSRDFHASTKIPEPVAGFASRGAAFVVFDDEQAMIHELVHLVAHAKIGDSTSPIKTEGLANALLEYSHGVQVHAWAKYYRVTGQLPTLAVLLGRRDLSVKGNAVGYLNVYDIAASWMRFVMERYGAAGLKQYYLEADPQKIFGTPVASVEQEWFAMLDSYRLRPEVSALLDTRHGISGADGLVLNAGESITLTVHAKQTPDKIPTGTSARFQWSKDGEEILGATAAQLALRGVKQGDGGIYTVTERKDGEEILGATTTQLALRGVKQGDGGVYTVTKCEDGDETVAMTRYVLKVIESSATARP